MEQQQVSVISSTCFLQLNEQLKQKFDSQEQVIFVSDADRSHNLQSIDFQPIYSYCVHLTLKIKGFKTDQHDFDQFCNKFSKFSQLKSLNLRYYSKRIQFLDSLFLNLKNLDRIYLQFKNFRKIQLKEDYSNEQFSARYLEINLTNSIIKETSVNNFAIFLRQHNNLQDLNLYMDKKASLMILEHVKKETKIHLTFYKQDLTLKSCDSLIYLITKELKNISFVPESICVTLKEYLYRNGLLDYDPSEPFIVKNNTFLLNKFVEYDFVLQKQIPYLINRIKEVSKQTKEIKIQISSLKYLFEYMMVYFNKYFDRIQFCTTHSYYYGQFPMSIKIQKVNPFSWSFDINNYEDTEFLQKFNCIVNLNIKFKVNISKRISIKIYNFIKEQRFLICITAPAIIVDKNLDSLIELQREKAQITLNYIIFKKQIYDLLPTPSQIFYDLLSKD